MPKEFWITIAIIYGALIAGFVIGRYTDFGTNFWVAAVASSAITTLGIWVRKKLEH